MRTPLTLGFALLLVTVRRTVKDLLAVPRPRSWPAAASPGYRPVSARVLGRQGAAGEPVTAQRRNPAQRTGRGERRRPAGEQDAFPHAHLLVVGHPDRADHRPDSQPQAPPAQAIMSPAPFRNAPLRERLARTMSGSRGSGESARATGVRSGPSVVRCGYGSSLTSPVIDQGRPGSFVDSAFASNSSGKCRAYLQSSGAWTSAAGRRRAPACQQIRVGGSGLRSGSAASTDRQG